MKLLLLLSLSFLLTACAATVPVQTVTTKTDTLVTVQQKVIHDTTNLSPIYYGGQNTGCDTAAILAKASFIIAKQNSQGGVSLYKYNALGYSSFDLADLRYSPLPYLFSRGRDSLPVKPSGLRFAFLIVYLDISFGYHFTTSSGRASWFLILRLTSLRLNFFISSPFQSNACQEQVCYKR